MSDYGKSIVMLAVVVVAMLAFGVYYVNAAIDCGARGGALVRGVWLYECVEVKK